jgi:hypothetical protein
MNTLVISDLEGKDLNLLLKTKEFLEPNSRVIICGDVLDSTTVYKDITSDDKRKFNLHNLLSIYTNDKIDLVCGNRDTHKIQQLLLGELDPVDKSSYNTEDTELINQFNNGSIEFTDYSRLKELLNTPGPKWKILNIWSDEIDTTSEIVEFLFHNRFIATFQSAPNIIYTIPLELKIRTELTGDNLNDYYAFIVFVVYNSLLQKIKKSPNEYESTMFDESLTNCKKFSGLLYNVYLKMKLIKYVPHGNIDYFFSHGGIKNTFYKDPALLYRYWKFILDSNTHNREQVYLDGISCNITYTGSTPEEFESYCNNFLSKLINSIYTDTSKSINEVRLLLSLSAEIKCKDPELDSKPISNVKRCTVTKDEKTYHNPLKKTTTVPILSGYREIMKDSLETTDLIVLDPQIRRRFNVFGHKPAGFSPIIKELKIL